MNAIHQSERNIRWYENLGVYVRVENPRSRTYDKHYFEFLSPADEVVSLRKRCADLEVRVVECSDFARNHLALAKTLREHGECGAHELNRARHFIGTRRVMRRQIILMNRRAEALAAELQQAAE